MCVWQLEERIYTALVSLCEAEPECDRHMFVYPTTLVGPVGDHLPGRLRTVREDVVALIFRPPI
jgi:hypothetical protein